MASHKNGNLQQIINDNEFWMLARRYGSVILLESAISVNGRKLDQIQKSYHKISKIIKDKNNILTGLISYKGNTPYKRMEKIKFFPDFIFRVNSYEPAKLYNCCKGCKKLNNKNMAKLISEYNPIRKGKIENIDVHPAFLGANNPNSSYSNEIGYIFERYLIESFRDVLCSDACEIRQRVIRGKPKRREDKAEGDTDIVIFCNKDYFRKQMNVLKVGFDKGGLDIACRIRYKDSYEKL